MRRSLCLLLLSVPAACHRDAPSAPDAGASAAGLTGDAAVAGLLPARCRPAGAGPSLADAGGGELEVGVATPYELGYAVSFVRRSASGPLSSVLLVAADGSSARAFDLGATLGDGPPAQLASCGATLVAAAYERASTRDGGAGAEARRSLAVWSVSAAGIQRIASVQEASDDSLAFDVACSGASPSEALLVWDESAVATAGPARGVVRIASLAAGRAPLVRDLSPPETDAELPRVVRAGPRWLAFWVAHRPEPPPRGDGSADIEAIGEAPTYGWLEMATVERDGRALGSPRRLTSSSGHVSVYDVLAGGSDDAPALDVVARDDGEASEGSGGALWRVHVAGDRAEPPALVPNDGLGRGAPAFVADRAGPWLSWVGPREEIRLEPLDPAGVTVAAPSAEETLDEGRPLLAIGDGGRMLVATAKEPSASLRVYTCLR